MSTIEGLNREAILQDKNREDTEEDFFKNRLMLISIPDPFHIDTVEMLNKRYNLSTQITNGPLKKKFETSRVTWFVWILQFKTLETKKLAMESLRHYPPDQNIQFLDCWDQKHSYCRTEIDEKEQEIWHRSCCDLHLHRYYHNRIIKRSLQGI